MHDKFLELLNRLRILPRRLLLETPGVQATVPMLRGVWGAALHDLDSAAYGAVFHPPESDPRAPGPAYVIRPAPPDPAYAPALDWIIFGPALAHDLALQRAWDIASGMGLGPHRHRFHIRQVTLLRPDGSMVDAAFGGWTGSRGAPSAGWSLDELAWPWPAPETTPCRLVFPSPLRLRRHGRLIDAPTLPDLMANIIRRIGAFLPPPDQQPWTHLGKAALEQSRSTRAHLWKGTRLDLHRYSGSQRAELDLHGVVGSLELPEGPGPLWPLLAAAQWLHLGKSTILGLGQLCLETVTPVSPLPQPRGSSRHERHR